MKKIIIIGVLFMAVMVGGAHHSMKQAQEDTLIAEQELIKVTDAYTVKDEELAKASTELATTVKELETVKLTNADLSSKLDKANAEVNKLKAQLEEEQRKK